MDKVSCKGKCKGERSAIDGPAVWVYLHSGKRALFCPCCEKFLKYKPVDFTTGSPNVRPGIERKKDYRFEDSICNYDTVVLVGVK